MSAVENDNNNNFLNDLDSEHICNNLAEEIRLGLQERFYPILDDREGIGITNHYTETPPVGNDNVYYILVRKDGIDYRLRNEEQKYRVFYDFENGEAYLDGEVQTPRFLQAFKDKLDRVSEDLSKNNAFIFEEVYRKDNPHG